VVDVSPSDNTARAGINRQAQDIAPPPRFAGDNPVRSPPIHVSYATNAIALGNTDGFPAIDKARMAIDPNAVAVNC
jgi:hypothetical protein